MNIAVLIAAVANKTAGWEDLLIDEWECIQTHYPNYIKLLEILSGQGVNPNATTGQDLLEPLINGVAIGHKQVAYGTGTPYSLTNVAALLNMGTTDPDITITPPVVRCGMVTPTTLCTATSAITGAAEAIVPEAIVKSTCRSSF